jgi:RecA/RadA recombinase
LASIRERSPANRVEEKGRGQAVEMALAQVEKQHGKGAIMRLGDMGTRLDVETISTGSLALDLALGVGGIPRGRIIEVYGPEGSGKCLTADTYVWTDQGLETVAELFERSGQKASCTSRITDITELDVRAVNEKGELEQVAALTHNNRRPVLKVTLRSGRSIEVTENHPLRVVDDNGFIVWRTAGKMQAGDTVVSATFGAVEAASGDGLSEDEAVFLGYLVAEGSLSATTAVRFTNWDTEVGAEFTKLAEGLFDAKVVNYYDKEYAIHSKALRDELAERYDMEFVTAHGKRVPHCVRTAGHKVQRAFLSALFEGDGWIDKSSTIGLGTASEQLAREVQLLLYGFGIPATVSSKFNQSYQRDYWSVTINPCATHRFLDEIGFRSERRRKQVETNYRPSKDDLVEAAESRYTFEKVVSIEDGGIKPTFDLMLPRTHSFVANGILSHNTTVSLHVIAEAQKTGGLVAFIDAEHALDPVYAKALGVDVDNLLVSQPDTGEQALEIADTLVRSGAMDVIVIDSVAALVPRAEIEGEMGDTHVGLQARLMSQALRKLTGSVSRTKTALLFINQIREKIGVMFGCFSYGTRVTLADGTQERIGKIVNQQMPVEVLSYNFETGKVEPKPVVDWYRNGKADHFLQFTALRPGRTNGKAQFGATPNHKIRTPAGWKEAKELRVGDRVLLAVEDRLSDLQFELVRGAVMGDGNLSKTKRSDLIDSGIRFRMGHGSAQASYLDWKCSLLSNIPMSRTTREDGSVHADLTQIVELSDLRGEVYAEDKKKSLSWDYLKQLTPFSLAIWYMDDGHLDIRDEAKTSARIQICVQAMSRDTRERLVDYLRDTWDLDVRLASVRGKAIILFTKLAAEEFQELVAPFIHPSMEYKLLPQYRGRFSVEPQFKDLSYELAPYPIVDIHVKPPTRSMEKFDIEVEGNHNYFVDGVLVHNSNETTPGGRALKFYSSVRLDIRRIDSLKDGAEIVGSRVRVKVVKNKVAAPFRKAEFDIQYGFGISKEGSLLDVAIDNEIVRKSGAWFIYGEEQLGQGRENAKTFLSENADIAAEIELKIKEKLGLIASDGNGDDDDEVVIPEAATDADK